MARASLAVAAVLALTMTGCFRTVIDTPAASSGIEKTDVGVTWLALTSTTTHASECTYGIAKAEAYMPVWGVLAYWFTAGIAAPMRTLYTCAVPPGGQQ